MLTASPSVQPTAVGPTGVIVDVEIPPGFRRFRVDEIRIRQYAGSSHSTNVAVTTDTISTTPGTYDPNKAVLEYQENLRKCSIVDDNDGSGYAHSGESSTGSWRIHLVPDRGDDNDYEVTFIIGRRF